MKTIIIISITLVGLFVLLQSFVMFSTSGIEKHQYKVIKTYDDFEVRAYESALFSSVVLNDSTYEASSNKGFRVLAGYIFGGNEEGEKIAMTSPVAMEIGDSTKMSFMVPSKYNEKDLPKPNSDKIFFEQKPESIMAAIRFGGWANDEKIEEYQNKLKDLLKKNNIQHTGKFVYLGYNPPYAVVARRNEIIVELVNFKN
ncbi:MAG: heme-binding protein [Bacteroidetes bacterium]|nr:MAG: heme-binding protein [Bacteroidota bacterium]